MSSNLTSGTTTPSWAWSRAYIGWMKYPSANEMSPIAAARMVLRRVKIPLRPLVRVVTNGLPWLILLP